MGSPELATKQDVETLGLALRADMAELRSDFAELRGEVASQRSDWQAGLASLEATMSERMRQQLVAIIGLNISMFVAAVTAAFALVQLS